MKIALTAFAALYFVAWMFAWSGELAYWRKHYPGGASCREDMAWSMGHTLIPLAPLIAPFLTGFYEHGHQWACDAD